MTQTTLVPESADFSAVMLGRARQGGEGVVIFPQYEKNGLGIYAQESVFLVKELRAEGVTARYLHDSASRTFEVRKSADPVAVTLFLGIASSAAWDGLKILITRFPKQQLRVTYVDLQQPDGGRATSWTVSGDSEAVLEAIDRLRRQNRD